MSVITTGSIPKAVSLAATAVTFWGSKYPKAEEGWPSIFESKPPPKASYAEDVGLSGLGLMRRKNETTGISYDTIKQSYVTRYIPTVWALGYIVSEEMMDDGTALGSILSGNEGLMFSAMQTRCVLAFDTFNEADDSTNYPGGDGVSLLNASHPKYKTSGEVYSNTPAVAVDVSEAALEAAAIAVYNMEDDSGNVLGLKCRRVIASSSLEFELTRLLQTPGRVGTANNDINAIVRNSTFPDGFMCSPFITDTDMWGVQTNAPNGFKVYEWKKVTFDRDRDFGTRNLLMMALFRAVWGFTDPRCFYGSMGA